MKLNIVYQAFVRVFLIKSVVTSKMIYFCIDKMLMIASNFEYRIFRIVLYGAKIFTEFQHVRITQKLRSTRGT